MIVLAGCTISHFCSVSCLTTVTAAERIDQRFKSVSASLRLPFQRANARVTLPAVLDSATTTVSAMGFIDAPRSTLLIQGHLLHSQAWRRR